MPQRRHSRDHAVMTIVYLRTQNRLTCIWSAMRAVPCLGALIGVMRVLCFSAWLHCVSREAAMGPGR